MPWTKISEKLIKDGFRKICQKTFILPNGTCQDFEIKKEGEAVCALALTPDNKVILAQQFRPGPEKVLLELPGGVVNSGEEPLVAMGRELLEETGYEGEIQYVTTALDCAYSTSLRHCFVVLNCRQVKEQQLDSTEFIEIIEMPLGDFREHLRSGQLTDIEVGYLGLDFLNFL
jgi:ADP-ribose pyrophosphatase